MSSHEMTNRADWDVLIVDSTIPRPRLTAWIMTYLRAVNSSMLPTKILGTDGLYYMLKKIEGGQARYDGQPLTPYPGLALVAEFVVAHLGELIEAPVAPVSLINMAPRLIGRQVQAKTWGSEEPPSYEVQDVVGLASLYIENAEEIPGPPQHLEQADNTVMAARMMALWDLTMGSDPQFLYALNSLKIVSFDHSHYFDRCCMGKPISALADRMENAYEIPGFAPPATCAPELRRVAHQMVKHVTRTRIAAILNSIPTQWQVTNEELATLGWVIENRIPYVAQRLLATADNLVTQAQAHRVAAVFSAASPPVHRKSSGSGVLRQTTSSLEDLHAPQLFATALLPANHKVVSPYR